MTCEKQTHYFIISNAGNLEDQSLGEVMLTLHGVLGTFKFNISKTDHCSDLLLTLDSYVNQSEGIIENKISHCFELCGNFACTTQIEFDKTIIMKFDNGITMDKLIVELYTIEVFKAQDGSASHVKTLCENKKMSMVIVIFFSKIGDNVLLSDFSLIENLIEVYRIKSSEFIEIFFGKMGMIDESVKQIWSRQKYTQINETKHITNELMLADEISTSAENSKNIRNCGSGEKYQNKEIRKNLSEKCRNITIYGACSSERCRLLENICKKYSQKDCTMSVNHKSKEVKIVGKNFDLFQIYVRIITTQLRAFDCKEITIMSRKLFNHLTKNNYIKNRFENIVTKAKFDSVILVENRHNRPAVLGLNRIITDNFIKWLQKEIINEFIKLHRPIENDESTALKNSLSYLELKRMVSIELNNDEITIQGLAVDVFCIIPNVIKHVSLLGRPSTIQNPLQNHIPSYSFIAPVTWMDNNQGVILYHEDCFQPSKFRTFMSSSSSRPATKAEMLNMHASSCQTASIASATKSIPSPEISPIISIPSTYLSSVSSQTSISSSAHVTKTSSSSTRNSISYPPETPSSTNIISSQLRDPLSINKNALSIQSHKSIFKYSETHAEESPISLNVTSTPIQANEFALELPQASCLLNKVVDTVIKMNNVSSGSTSTNIDASKTKYCPKIQKHRTSKSSSSSRRAKKPQLSNMPASSCQTTSTATTMTSITPLQISFLPIEVVDTTIKMNNVTSGSTSTNIDAPKAMIIDKLKTMLPVTFNPNKSNSNDTHDKMCKEFVTCTDPPSTVTTSYLSPILGKLCTLTLPTIHVISSNKLTISTTCAHTSLEISSSPLLTPSLSSTSKIFTAKNEIHVIPKTSSLLYKMDNIDEIATSQKILLPSSMSNTEISVPIQKHPLDSSSKTGNTIFSEVSLTTEPLTLTSIAETSQHLIPNYQQPSGSISATEQSRDRNKISMSSFGSIAPAAHERLIALPTPNVIACTISSHLKLSISSHSISSHPTSTISSMNGSTTVQVHTSNLDHKCSSGCQVCSLKEFKSFSSSTNKSPIISIPSTRVMHSTMSNKTSILSESSSLTCMAKTSSSFTRNSISNSSETPSSINKISSILTDPLSVNKDASSIQSHKSISKYSETCTEKLARSPIPSNVTSKLKRANEFTSESSQRSYGYEPNSMWISTFAESLISPLELSVIAERINSSDQHRNPSRLSQQSWCSIF